MYEIVYAEMIRRSRITKEEHDAVEKFESAFEDAEFEWETGLPAIARRFGDATVAGAPVREGSLPSTPTASGGKR